VRRCVVERVAAWELFVEFVKQAMLVGTVFTATVLEEEIVVVVVAVVDEEGIDPCDELTVESILKALAMAMSGSEQTWMEVHERKGSRTVRLRTLNIQIKTGLPSHLIPIHLLSFPVCCFRWC